MKLHWLAWVNIFGWCALAWLLPAMSRAPVSLVERLGRSGTLLLGGLAFVAFCIALSRKAPRTSTFLLGLPPTAFFAIVVGLLGAALMGSL